MSGSNRNNVPSGGQRPEYEGQPYYDENGILRYPSANRGTQQDPYEEEYQRQLDEFSRISGTNENEDIDIQFHPIDEIYGTNGSSVPRRQGSQGGQRSSRPQQNKPNPRRTVGSAQKKQPSKKQSGAGQSKKKAPKTSGKYSAENLQFGSNSPQKQKNSKGKNKNVDNNTKKSHPIRTFFTVLILLVIVVFLLVNLLLWRYIGLVNIRDRGTRTVTDASMNDKNVTNILVIGSDTRDENVNGRTDSMILLSVNKESEEITMTSFMRDMYVEIVGKTSDGQSIDTWDKMNAAYVYGGAELLMDTIEHNFDIAVDDYVYIDFFSFVDIVDSLGGIEIEITDEEAEGMKAPMAEQNKILGNKKGTDYLTHGGKILMNGNQALAYSRLRYVGNADFERTERQRLVITKIIDKVKSSGLGTINDFAEASLSNLSTNMSKPQMMGMAYKAVFSLGYDIKSLRIPDDDSYGYGTTDSGQSILTVDFEKCKELLSKEIYKK